MQVKKIHNMQWADPEHKYVRLVADTDSGDNETIGTPYGEASIIWAAVQAFPVNQIAEYVPPVVELTPTQQ